MRRPAKLSAALLTAGMLLLSAVSAAQSAESPSSRAPEADPYGRLTPKQAIIGFLRATDEGDFERAAEYLDLRNLPDEITEYTPDQLALGFAIVLQRSLWLDIDSLSDDPAGAADDGLPSYRELIGTIPTSDGPTQLLLQRVPGEKPGVFVWKVSNATLSDLQRLFDDYRYSAYTEWFFENFPEGSLLGVEYYKWGAAFGVVLLSTPFLLLALWWLARLLVKPSRPLHDRLRALLLGPLAVLFLLTLFGWAIRDLGIGLEAQQYTRHQTLTIAATLWLLWGIVGFGRDLYAEFLLARGREGSIALLRPLTSAIRVIVLLFGLMVWLDNLGFQITALLTGLGIGGVAVALVLQKPLEDVLGAITLYTQQPIKVGDFGRFGPHTGTVEEISLRTTRIRTLDNTVVAVPNGRLATEAIENYSARQKILYKPILRLRNDTSLTQVEALVEGVRDLLAADENVLEEGARVRLTTIGGEAMEVAVFAYVNTTDWPTFLELAEALHLRILGKLEALEISLVLPLEGAMETLREQASS
jgi:MscS family membrane protein